MGRRTESIETVEHRGLDIHYDYEEGFWRCHDLELQNAQLKPLKEAINRKLAHEGKAQIAAILIGSGRWSDGHRKVKLTSVVDDRYCWVTYEGGSRSKAQNENVLLDTPENWKLIKEFDALVKVVETAQTAVDKFYKKLPHVSRKMLSEMRVKDAEDKA